MTKKRQIKQPQQCDADTIANDQINDVLDGFDDDDDDNALAMFDDCDDAIVTDSDEEGDA